MHKAIELYAKIAQHNSTYAFDQGNSHFHGYYEIYYLIKGRRRYVIDNTIYDVEAGDIILIPPMVMHKTQKIPGTPEEEIHERLLFNLYEMPEILKPCFEKYFYRPNGEAKDTIEKLIKESLEEEDSNKESSFLHSLNVQKLLLILLRMPKTQEAPQELSHKDRLMQNAACYIKENCHKPITLKNIADELGFAPEYFSSMFKSVIGLNFVDYLNNMRVARALTFLTETKLPISEISEKCGFNDSNYFAIVFKKVTGTSPTKYRKMMRE